MTTTSTPVRRQAARRPGHTSVALARKTAAAKPAKVQTPARPGKPGRPGKPSKPGRSIINAAG